MNRCSEEEDFFLNIYVFVFLKGKTLNNEKEKIITIGGIFSQLLWWV